MRGARARPTDGGTYLGLNSGTSADRIDAIVVDLPPGTRPLRARVRSAASLAIPTMVRREILAAPDGIDLRRLCRLDVELGVLFGRAARRAIDRAGIDPSRVRAAGLHGQTVCHLPAPRGSSATLQIGLPEAVALRASVPVVSHFRQADTARGGEGAPLSPALDRALFGDGSGALVLNLGGIANLTAVSEDGGRVVGLDVGPGNMLLDAIVRRRAGPDLDHDPGGRIALAGRVDRRLLRHALDHPFFARRSVRSTGREQFGDPFLRYFLAGARGRALRVEDLLATGAALTAEAAWRSFVRVAGPGRWGSWLWICGGGVRNRAVVRELRARFEPAGFQVRRFDRSGVTAANRECILFAFLAREFVGGRPVDLRDCTGAAPTILGRWTPRPV